MIHLGFFNILMHQCSRAIISQYTTRSIVWQNPQKMMRRLAFAGLDLMRVVSLQAHKTNKNSDFIRFVLVSAFTLETSRACDERTELLVWFASLMFLRLAVQLMFKPHRQPNVWGALNLRMSAWSSCLSDVFVDAMRWHVPRTLARQCSYLQFRRLLRCWREIPALMHIATDFPGLNNYNL